MARTRILLTALCLLSATALAHADDPARPHAGDARCADESAHCQHVQIRASGVCSDDPAKCEAAKNRLQQEAAECRADPQACKEKRRARREAACKDHPERPACQKLNDAAPDR
jgi:hypothetical protein